MPRENSLSLYNDSNEGVYNMTQEEALNYLKMYAYGYVSDGERYTAHSFDLTKETSDILIKMCDNYINGGCHRKRSKPPKVGKQYYAGMYSDYSKNYYTCANCDCGLRASSQWKDKYCPNCGVKIDWTAIK